MGRWFIVRHGETEWNAGGRIQGHIDIGLSESGINQAQSVSARLAEAPIDVAYSSDLQRCADTARQILGRRDVPLHVTPRLREYHKGVFEGLTWKETGERYPDLHAASLVKDLDFAPTAGESTRQVSVRLASLMCELRERHQQDNVLIVGHGGALRAAFVALMDLPLEANWRFVMANCGLSVVDVFPDNAVLCLFNDTCHLGGFGPELPGHSAPGNQSQPVDG